MEAIDVIQFSGTTFEMWERKLTHRGLQLEAVSQDAWLLQKEREKVRKFRYAYRLAQFVRER